MRRPRSWRAGSAPARQAPPSRGTVAPTPRMPPLSGAAIRRRGDPCGGGERAYDECSAEQRSHAPQDVATSTLVAIELNRVSKRFPGKRIVTALDDVSL